MWRIERKWGNKQRSNPRPYQVGISLVGEEERDKGRPRAVVILAWGSEEGEGEERTGWVKERRRVLVQRPVA